MLELENGTRLRHRLVCDDNGSNHSKSDLNDDDGGSSNDNKIVLIKCRAMGGRACEELPGSTLLATKCLRGKFVLNYYRPSGILGGKRYWK